ncbi:unnamed protein product, partial [Closterium sp. Naga37s-1]
FSPIRTPSAPRHHRCSIQPSTMVKLQNGFTKAKRTLLMPVMRSPTDPAAYSRAAWWAAATAVVAVVPFTSPSCTPPDPPEPSTPTAAATVAREASESALSGALP